jgi:hypothetical protein
VVAKEVTGMSRMAYNWNGEPIEDIHAWCRERGEQMVRVKHTWREAMLLAGELVDREEVTEMPASFFSSLRFGGMRDDSYDEIDRYDP